MRTIFVLLLGVACGLAQETPVNRLTLTGGWTRLVGGYSYEDKQTAVGLGISYGRRVHRYIEPEVGFFVALDPTGDVCGRFGCVDVGDRFYWLGFGARFVAPLAWNRVEFSGGGGGLIERYTVDSMAPGGGPIGRRGWGGYFMGSVAVPLDRGRHWWLGATPRWFLANPRFARDRWFQIAGEISMRFP